MSNTTIELDLTDEEIHNILDRIIAQSQLSSPSLDLIVWKEDETSIEERHRSLGEALQNEFFIRLVQVMIENGE